MKLLVATRNTHKLREIQAILALPELELVSLDAFPNVPEVVEDGATFEINAVKKAVIVALATKMWTMADDSGLEVEVLDGAPGVRSARYAGEPVNYAANNAKLLNELRRATNRRACFRCVIAISSPSGRSQIVDGRCRGHIADASHGTSGFGYDPLFVPNGYDQTFAEMNSELKNRISHRGTALAMAKERWGDWLSGKTAARWG
jgi:XTP/dITP diphosphohydrolase